jgi:2-oxoglutarate dehydrogenase complex dehydrogenase (E1) component-like enzyme
MTSLEEIAREPGVLYVGRDEGASPGTGSYQVHQEEERTTLERALAPAEAAHRALLEV